MAGVARRLGDRGVSLESIVQHRPQTLHAPAGTSKSVGDTAQPVIIITHETTEEALRKALEGIEKDGNVTERPQMIRIEEL
jgi:homoserine dehydrogenase